MGACFRGFEPVLQVKMFLTKSNAAMVNPRPEATKKE
jgi:hypothetical protein